MTTLSRLYRSAASLFLAVPMSVGVVSAAETPSGATGGDTTRTHYRTAKVEGVDVFYREAGPVDAPVIVLLHGFPTSSHMYRDLIPRLADRYRVIAPDYPGFGQSGVPDRKTFAYTFAHLADVTDGLLVQLGATKYALYVQDYGAPVGYRIAVKHPDRVTALVIQNGNAYDEGFSDFWKPLQALWADGSKAHREVMRAGLTPAATKSQYVDGVRDRSRVDPDNWVHDQALLDRPGVDEIMLDLFQDYGSNVRLYPQFQQFFRAKHPPTLIAWGRNDLIFPASGARAYLKDIPDAELHLLDTGHFALEDQGEEIARLMRDFLDRRLPRD